MYVDVDVFLHACMRAVHTVHVVPCAECVARFVSLNAYDTRYSYAPCNLANTQANRRLGSVYLFHLGQQNQCPLVVTHSLL